MTPKTLPSKLVATDGDFLPFFPLIFVAIVPGPLPSVTVVGVYPN